MTYKTHASSLYEKMMTCIEYIEYRAGLDLEPSKAERQRMEDYFRLLEAVTIIYKHIEPDRPDYSVKTLADAMDVSEKLIRKLIASGDLEGAYQLEHMWRIPYAAAQTYRARHAARKLDISLPKRRRGRDAPKPYEPGDIVVRAPAPARKED